MLISYQLLLTIPSVKMPAGADIILQKGAGSSPYLSDSICRWSCLRKFEVCRMVLAVTAARLFLSPVYFPEIRLKVSDLASLITDLLVTD